MPLVVTCEPSTVAVESVAPCTDFEGSPTVPVVAEIGLPRPVNFDNANQLFAYSLMVVVVFWAIGVTVGAILSLIRNGS